MLASKSLVTWHSVQTTSASPMDGVAQGQLIPPSAPPSKPHVITFRTRKGQMHHFSSCLLFSISLYERVSASMSLSASGLSAANGLSPLYVTSVLSPRWWLW